MSERPADYPVPVAIAAHPAWHRLESQRTYYSSRAGSFQTTYKQIKLALIAISSAIPLMALAGDHAIWKYIVALGGVAIAVMEGTLLLNQFGPLWIKYRAIAESLKRERWLLLSRAGDYKGLSDDDAMRLLAERVEVLLEVEHREWTQEQRQALAQLANTQEWVKRQRAEAQDAPAPAGEVSPATARAGSDVAFIPTGADAAAGNGSGGADGATVQADAADLVIPASPSEADDATTRQEPAAMTAEAAASDLTPPPARVS
jgi:hypothetical protein